MNPEPLYQETLPEAIIHNEPDRHGLRWEVQIRTADGDFTREFDTLDEVHDYVRTWAQARRVSVGIHFEYKTGAIQ